MRAVGGDGDGFVETWGLEVLVGFRWVGEVVKGGAGGCMYGL